MTEGWKLIEEVHKQDGYDVTAFNLVTLHKQMEKFQTLTNANFIVHMKPLEAGLYGDNVLELLSRARDPHPQIRGDPYPANGGGHFSRGKKILPCERLACRTIPAIWAFVFGSVITANNPASQAPNPAN